MIFPKDVVNKVEVRKEAAAEKDSLSKSGTLLEGIEEINTLFWGGVSLQKKEKTNRVLIS
jgi:hypothetical protein